MLKKFINDGAVLLVSEFLSRIFSFSVTFVLARQLGLEALATLALAQSLVAFATVAGDAGLGTSAVRRISRGDDARSVVRETAKAQVAITVLALLVVVPIAAMQTNPLLVLVLALVPLFYAASPGYVLQAKLMATGIGVSRILGNLGTGVVGVTLSLLRAPLWCVAISYGLGAMIGLLYTIRVARVAFSDVVGWPDLSPYRDAWRSYVSLALFTLVLQAYWSALLILSQLFGDGAHFIVTSVATRILFLLSIPGVIIGSLLLPRYSAAGSKSKVWHHVLASLGAGALISGGVQICAQWFVPLMFGPEAISSIDAVRAISLQVPLAMANSVLLAYLLSAGRYGLSAAGYLLALGSQILFGWLLFGQSSSGFVLAMVTSELVFFGFLSIAYGTLRRAVATGKRASSVVDTQTGISEGEQGVSEEAL